MYSKTAEKSGIWNIVYSKTAEKSGIWNIEYRRGEMFLLFTLYSLIHHKSYTCRSRGRPHSQLSSKYVTPARTDLDREGHAEVAERLHAESRAAYKLAKQRVKEAAAAASKKKKPPLLCVGGTSRSLFIIRR